MIVLVKVVSNWEQQFEELTGFKKEQCILNLLLTTVLYTAYYLFNPSWLIL